MSDNVRVSNNPSSGEVSERFSSGEVSGLSVQMARLPVLFTSPLPLILFPASVLGFPGMFGVLTKNGSSLAGERVREGSLGSGEGF